MQGVLPSEVATISAQIVNLEVFPSKHMNTNTISFFSFSLSDPVTTEERPVSGVWGVSGVDAARLNFLDVAKFP